MGDWSQRTKEDKVVQKLRYWRENLSGVESMTDYQKEVIREQAQARNLVQTEMQSGLEKGADVGGKEQWKKNEAYMEK